MLGISQQMVDLIQAHYSIAATGRGQVAGRPARIVQLTRPDGSLAARFWLDQGSNLLLRRETFDTGSAHYAGTVTFGAGGTGPVDGAVQVDPQVGQVTYPLSSGGQDVQKIKSCG